MAPFELLRRLGGFWRLPEGYIAQPPKVKLTCLTNSYSQTKKVAVLHWTHHEPSGRYSDGWLKHNGQVYR